LNVTGNTTLANTTTGTLNAGNTTVGTLAAGNTTVTGNATVSGTLTAGNTTVGTLIAGNTTVQGNAAVVGTLTAGNATVGTLSAGNSTVGTLSAGNTTTANAQVNGTLAVTGASTTNGLSNTGNITTDTLSTTGNASVGGSLNMNGNRINNVGPGVAGTDAVNINQLAAVEKKLSSGVASAAAMAALPEPGAGQTASIGVATAGYNGQAAIAVGGSYRSPTGNVTFKYGAAYSGNRTTVSAGVGFSW
jgi:trimeric autotransporter adhesin